MRKHVIVCVAGIATLALVGCGKTTVEGADAPLDSNLALPAQATGCIQGVIINGLTGERVDLPAANASDDNASAMESVSPGSVNGRAQTARVCARASLQDGKCIRTPKARTGLPSKARRRERCDRSSNLERAVLYCQRRCIVMRRDVMRGDRGAADGRDGVTQPRRWRQQRRRDRRHGGVVRRLCQRMAVLVTARLVSRCRRMARRRLRGHLVRAAAVERTGVARHGQLLEQQAQKRDQRDPVAVAVT